MDLKTSDTTGAITMGATDAETSGPLRDRVVYDIATACKLLADPLRLCLLLLMAQEGEINVGDLCARVGQGQPARQPPPRPAAGRRPRGGRAAGQEQLLPREDRPRRRPARDAPRGGGRAAGEDQVRRLHAGPQGVAFARRRGPSRPRPVGWIAPYERSRSPQRAQGSRRGLTIARSTSIRASPKSALHRSQWTRSV